MRRRREAPEAAPRPAGDDAARDAAPTPTHAGASPAEAYGFAGFVLTGVFFVMYLLWAYVPDDVLRAAGIAYYPDKYWALAVPIWIFALGLYVAWAYEGVNRMTVRSRDDEDLIQERTGSILTAVEDPEPEGSVPTIRDVPLEEVCRVLFRTPGGDRRVRRRAPEAELAG